MSRFALCCLLLMSATIARAATPPPIDHEWALPAPNQYLDPKDICLGSDGSMWFTLNGAPKIGRITPEAGDHVVSDERGICPRTSTFVT
jgi:streptogramin lyase